VKDGVLDRRLVRSYLPLPVTQDMNYVPLGYVGEERILRDMRAECCGLRRPLRLYQARRSRLSCRVLQTHDYYASVHM
jgi:hypothetical protein